MPPKPKTSLTYYELGMIWSPQFCPEAYSVTQYFMCLESTGTTQAIYMFLAQELGPKGTNFYIILMFVR